MEPLRPFIPLPTAAKPRVLAITNLTTVIRIAQRLSDQSGDFTFANATVTVDQVLSKEANMPYTLIVAPR